MRALRARVRVRVCVPLCLCTCAAIVESLWDTSHASAESLQCHLRPSIMRNEDGTTSNGPRLSLSSSVAPSFATFFYGRASSSRKRRPLVMNARRLIIRMQISDDYSSLFCLFSTAGRRLVSQCRRRRRRHGKTERVVKGKRSGNRRRQNGGVD